MVTVREGAGVSPGGGDGGGPSASADGLTNVMNPAKKANRDRSRRVMNRAAFMAPVVPWGRGARIVLVETALSAGKRDEDRVITGFWRNGRRPPSCEPWERRRCGTAPPDGR